MKQRWKKGICLVFALLLLCGSFTVQAEEEVKVSDKEYMVSLMDANSIFISNQKAVSGKVGTKVFLTYTVEHVTKNAVDITGVVATNNPMEGYPYAKDGRIEYANESVLFEEGYTYVYGFEITDNGLSYRCAKMKGKEAKYINFTNFQESADASGAYKHFGIWADGGAGAGVSAILNHVRCYDAQGNDLGVQFNRSTAMMQDEANKLLDVHLTVDTSYSFTMEEASTVAIGNKYVTDSDVVYMEYEVEDVQDKTIQQGTLCAETLITSSGYPFAGTNGLVMLMEYKPDDEKPLLKEGAKYFICFSKKEDGFDAMVQCTLNGKTETFSFPYPAGAYNQKFGFFGLWFGDGPENAFSAKFKNFKCYDAEGNNLGVQLSRGSTQITLYGEPEDYSLSEATYFCKENQTFLVLADEQKVVKQVGSKKTEGTYKILNRDELYLSLKDGKEAYDYTAMVIRDEEGNEYKRLNDKKVTFVTGEEKIVEQATAANGYRVMKPEDPKKEGHTFKGWYLNNDTAFDFDTVVAESITLYAKWQDGDGNEYLAVDQLGKADVAMVLGIAVSAVILAAGITGCMMIVRRRKQHGKG